MKKIISLLLSLMFLLSLCVFAQAESAERAYVRITIQDIGVLYAELYPDVAPKTVENFVSLAESGFYNGLTFHRVIAGFMIQGGDPLGNGTGGSENKIEGEFSANGFENPLNHTRGVLSMARSSDMNGASSQFFIMHADASHLDGNYAAFGKVLSGMYAVDKVCSLTPVSDSNGTVPAGCQPVIEEICVVPAAEALEAAQKEAEDTAGLPGTQYRDPGSEVCFTVPEGYTKSEQSNGVVLYFLNGEGGLGFAMGMTDLYEMLSLHGYLAEDTARETMNSNTLQKEDILAMMGQEESDLFDMVEVNNLNWCVGTNESGVTQAFAEWNGFVYWVQAPAEKDTPEYDTVLSLLNSMTFTNRSADE